MLLPGVIIFVNDSVNLSFDNMFPTDTGVQPSGLVPLTPYTSAISGIDVQLQINETITKAEFDARVAADPNYPKVIHLQRLRVLVILSDFQDTTNRNLADVVMFVKQGLTSVEKCKYGEPGFTLDTQRLNILNLLFGVKHQPGTIFCFPCEEGFDYDDGYCPPPFPPPICPPQTQTLENPRPPEHLSPRRIEGLGALELLGTERLEELQGPGESAFGGPLGGDRDDDDELAEGDTDGEV